MKTPNVVEATNKPGLYDKLEALKKRWVPSCPDRGARRWREPRSGWRSPVGPEHAHHAMEQCPPVWARRGGLAGPAHGLLQDRSSCRGVGWRGPRHAVLTSRVPACPQAGRV